MCRIRRSTAGWKPANIGVISVLFCVTVAIANDGVRTAEDASETASASNNVLRESIHAAKERAFRSIPPKLRQTLTVDNGKEFACHEQLSERLQLPIYFAHAYSSNERATNENTNGLLRQYFPKKTDFRDISHHALAHVTNRLNNRPRKRLNYLTPLEALNNAGFALQM